MEHIENLDEHHQKIQQLIQTEDENIDVEELCKLRWEGPWREEHRNTALVAAEEAGNALQILREFELPLRLYPHEAEILKADVLRDIDKYVDPEHHDDLYHAASKREHKLKEAAPSLSKRGSCLPTQQANLLANFLMVHGSVAEDIMNGIVEPMVVYHADRLSRCQVASMVTRFPAALRPFFLERTSKSNLQYDRRAMEMRVDLNSDPQRTSKEYRITLDKPARRQCLIPLKAKSFVYVYSDNPSMLGGFLYLSDYQSGEPLALNVITLSQRRRVLPFEPPVRLTEKDAERFKREEFNPKDITAGYMRDAGAVNVAFIGPGEEVAGGPVEVGGFAYFFEEASKNCFFPMGPATTVVDRASIGADRTNVGILPMNPQAKQIQQNVTLTRTLSAKAKGFGAPTAQIHALLHAADVPVQFARLKVPLVLHPVVLRALGLTPRTQARETRAARVIAQAAFMRARGSLVFKACFELVSTAAICTIIWKVREGRVLAEQRDFQLTFAALIVVFLKNIIFEFCIFWSFAKYGWSRDYFSTSRLLMLAHLLGMFLMFIFIWLYAGVCSSKVEIDSEIANATLTNEISEHATTSTEADWEVVLRPLLALAAFQKWMRVLHIGSNFEVFRLGPRILPILQALGEVFDFFLISAFFICGCVQAGYALSGDSFIRILQKTYNLAFLGEFAAEDDEIFLPGYEGSPHLWLHLQHLFFWGASFLLAVALTNIFIGIMSNAFDFYTEKVGQLFVQRRVLTGLDYALFLQGLHSLTGLSFLDDWGHWATWNERDHLLWFCYRDEDDIDEGDQCLRKVLRQMSRQTTHELEELHSMVWALVQDQLEGKAALVGLQERVGTAFRHTKTSFAELEMQAMRSSHTASSQRPPSRQSWPARNQDTE